MPVKIPIFITLPALLLILLLISYFLTNIGSGKSNFENFFLGSQNIFEELAHIEDPLENLVGETPQNFNGSMAIFVKDLKTAKTYQVNADQKFSSASLYKLAVLYATYDTLKKNQIQKDEILSQSRSKLDQTLTNIQGQSPAPTNETIAYPVSEALRLMITISDNYSAILLSEKLGWKNIDALMEKEGFADIDLIENDTPTVTARAVGNLLEKIYRNAAVSPEASEEMKKLLFVQQI